MPWFDLLVRALPPSAMDRARQLAAEQRAREDERRRAEALKAKATAARSVRGTNPDTSIQRRPIGVRSGGPFVIYTGPTDVGLRVVSTGGTFLNASLSYQEVLRTPGQDAIEVETVTLSEWHWTGITYIQRTIFRPRQYSLIDGPFGEPCVLRSGSRNTIRLPSGPEIYFPTWQYGTPETGWVPRQLYGWLAQEDEPFPGIAGTIVAGSPQLNFYFRILATSDFTLEGWWRCWIVNSDGNPPVDSGWTHSAACRQNGIYSQWLNGVSVPVTGDPSQALGILFIGTNDGPSAYNDDNPGYKLIGISGLTDSDIGQFRITLDAALYSGEVIDIPASPWV